MLKMILKSWAYKPLAVLVCCAMFSLSMHASPNSQIVVRAGTNVPLVLDNAVTSNASARVGQMVAFRVASDVTVNGKVVIARGTAAKAQISAVEPPKAIGRPGTVEVKVVSVSAVDGTEIYLNNNTLQQEGKNKMGLSIGLGVLVCLLCLIIKGGQAQIPAGTTCNAFVLGDTNVSVN